MKKKILIMIIATQMMILHTCGMAYAAGYDKTIDYRYKLLGYDGNWWDGVYTAWRTDREFNFTDTNTDEMTMRNSNNNTTTITTVNVVSSADGHYTFKGRKVAGAAGNIMLSDIENDYIYKYQTSKVDTDYTFTFTLSNPSNIRYNWSNVDIYAISRADGSYTLKETVYYRANPSEGEYAYGENYTYTGADGYNWTGFCMRVRAQCGNNEVYLDDNVYELWIFNSTLDTFTPEIDYGAQLDNINGTLGSIYSSITGGFTTVTNAITNIGSSILNGIEHLFVYDDWQEDLESITSEVDIPYIEDLTAAFADITNIFSTYNPDDEIDVKLKNPMYTLHGGREYMVNTTYSLDTPLSVGIGGYTIKQLFHIISGLFVLGYFVRIVTKLMAVFGIKFDEFILPWIREVIHK